jgi:hypothetical protein
VRGSSERPDDRGRAGPEAVAVFGDLDSSVSARHMIQTRNEEEHEHNHRDEWPRDGAGLRGHGVERTARQVEGLPSDHAEGGGVRT